MKKPSLYFEKCIYVHFPASGKYFRLTKRCPNTRTCYCNGLAIGLRDTSDHSDSGMNRSFISICLTISCVLPVDSSCLTNPGHQYSNTSVRNTLIELIWERKWNEPRMTRMTRMDTDKRENEGKESVPICVICGPKQTKLRKEKKLAGFGPTGHLRIHIKSLVSTPFRCAPLRDTPPRSTKKECGAEAD